MSLKNAADPSQVEDAKRKDRLRQMRRADDIRALMATPQGRRFVWGLLEHCGVFHSIWDGSAKIHYNAGRQDVGHYLMEEVMTADHEAYLLMQKEAQPDGEENA